MRRAPTVTQLSHACGFPVPQELVRLVACAVDEARGSEWFDVATALYGSTGFELSGALASALSRRREEYRYPNTPPEFVEFGRLGSDGVSYARAEEKARLERLAKALSIAPSLRKARWSSHMADTPNPPVPRGWVHQPAEDGVGVLAPARAFHPWQRQVRRNPWKQLELDPGDLDATLSFARRTVAAGYPATALLALNECFHAHWSGWRYPDAARRLRPARRRAYLALGRRAHARALAHTPDP